MSNGHRHRRFSNASRQSDIGEGVEDKGQVINSPGNQLMDLQYHTSHAQLEDVPIEVAQFEATSRIVYYTEPRSASADRFRILRIRLCELQEAKKTKTLLVTSPLPHDGKSTMVLNLATALSQRGKRSVLVLEGDLHRPTLTQQLGVNNGPGMAECLAKRIDPISAIRRVEPLGWYLLSAGTAVNNPSELLQAESLQALLQNLNSLFDWIIMDSPPILPLTDTISLAKSADASLLVARSGRTPRRAVDEAVTLLGRRNLCGIILNGIEGLDTYYASYGYY